jgi:NTE family protein
LIGALRACGCDARALMDIADYWRTRVGRFVEWRFWRMCLINEHVARKALVRHFGDRRVNQTDIPYAANAVDVKTGEEVSIRDGLLVDCVRASSALPGLLPPCDSGDRLLVDGGIIDPIPVTLARGMGCHFAIGVNAMASLASQQLTSRHPMNAFDVMTRCMMIMGHEMGQARAKATADVVFTPDLSDFTVLSFSRSADIVACGRRSAEAHLPLIQEAYTRLRRDRLG